LIINIFNPNYAVAIVGKQNFTIISSANVLLWIKRIAGSGLKVGDKALSK
jgi:hypothetical protein